MYDIDRTGARPARPKPGLVESPEPKTAGTAGRASEEGHTHPRRGESLPAVPVNLKRQTAQLNVIVERPLPVVELSE